MNEKDKELLAKIRAHLNKLHTEWHNDPERDGHHKMSEGAIDVNLGYGNWFDEGDYENREPHVSCSVYSYLFGPSRLHEFASMEEAWEKVSKWTYEK